MNLIRRSFLLFAVFSFLLLGSCNRANSEVTLRVRLADNTKTPNFTAEVVATPRSRSQGLMYRKNLADDRAMIFVFADETPRSFWMKNTYISLDIVYVDSQMKVGSMIENAEPLNEKPLPSAGPARYAIEMAGGLAAK